MYIIVKNSIAIIISLIRNFHSQPVMQEKEKKVRYYVNINPAIQLAISITTRFKWIGVHPSGIVEGWCKMTFASLLASYLQRHWKSSDHFAEKLLLLEPGALKLKVIVRESTASWRNEAVVCAWKANAFWYGIWFKSWNEAWNLIIRAFSLYDTSLGPWLVCTQLYVDHEDYN